MTAQIIQTSFHAGEWAPALNARVDLAKYHSAAALLRNFFVDYRGGASTRAGTKYILQCFKSATAVRLIPFQASFTVNYVLEFGDFYIRFFVNGAPVVETATNIINISQDDPALVSDIGHGYQTGDWVFIQNVAGMTQVNGKFFLIVRVDANSYQLYNLGDSPTSSIDSTSFNPYTAGGTAKRVYTLPSPYAAADLALLKFAQNVNTLVICHPSYVPYILTLISVTNWTILPIVFGSTVAAPVISGVASTLAVGTANYSYIVTSVDPNGQESLPSAAFPLANRNVLTGTDTTTVSWTAVSGVQYYNVYKSQYCVGAAVPTGQTYGFIGFSTGTSFIDTAVAPDFSLTPPVAENPFQGAPVASATITAAGNYSGLAVPTVTFAAAPAGGATATGTVTLRVQGTPTVANGGAVGSNAAPGDVITFTNGVTLVVATVDGSNKVLTFQPITFPGSNPGFVTSGTAPSPISMSPDPQVEGSRNIGGITANVVWGVGVINITSGGAGYTSAPAITFSAGAAAATAVLGPTSAGNPSVPSYFQQRLVLAGPSGSPQQFNMSQPGFYFNFNDSNPIQDDDAIQGTIASLRLNSIKSMTPMPGGLVTLGDQQAWQINGGGPTTPITPADANASAQAYNGSSDIPPIVVNYDIIYVQAKGSIVRDLSYNFYTNIYTGTDISVLSSHLFYGFTILGWAYAEEPFKVVWAVRSDGVVLSLTFLKEQEIIGWAHSDTNGSFKSVTTVTEQVSFGSVDAVYFVIERTVNGFTVQYIERMAERIFTNGVVDAWCVDSALSYSGAPATVFSGLEHLEGEEVTGIADGVSFGTKTVTNGSVTLGTAASNVLIGLAFLPELQTLQLDLGEPTVQGKMKKISGVTVRVQESLGLTIGTELGSLQTVMKDLVIGNVGSATNTLVTDLVTGDAKTVIDPKWQVPGQYFITQPNPYPATILGVIPEITLESTK